MGSGTKLDLQAFTEATRLPFPRIAKDVSGLLGLRLVAYIASVTGTRAVRQWMDGSQPVKSPTSARNCPPRRPQPHCR